MKSRHITSKRPSKRRKQGFKTKPERTAKPRSEKTIGPAAIKIFEPDASIVYSIEQTSQLARVPRRRILIYCRERLVSPLANPNVNGYWFDGETLRVLKQIEELRALCDEPMAGIRLILDLMAEVRRLRNEMRALEV